MLTKLSAKGVLAVCALGAIAAFGFHALEGRLDVAALARLFAGEHAKGLMAPGDSWLDRFLLADGPTLVVLFGGLLLHQMFYLLIPATIGLAMLDAALRHVQRQSRRDYFAGGLLFGIAAAALFLAVGWAAKWQTAAFLIAVCGFSALLYRLIAGDDPIPEIPPERFRAIRR